PGGSETKAAPGRAEYRPTKQPRHPITAPAPGTYNGNRLWLLPEATPDASRPWLQLTSPEALRTAINEAVRCRPASTP
ncbi:hypothetical protein ACFU99_27485, partial [Streptomyces sp. NPDC057654]|uniref:hypothetical protein n=1 Tax=Streptomyces sp. NPDC057654 TaxID=3346196 RepID=UPI0036C3F6E8